MHPDAGPFAQANLPDTTTMADADEQPAVDQEEQDFRDTLTTVVRMSNAEATKVTNNGIVTAADLSLMDQDSIMDIFKPRGSGRNQAVPNAMILMRLKALKAWVDEQVDTYGEDELDVTDFDNATCREYQRRLARASTKQHDGGKKTKMGEPDSKSLKFDGKRDRWENSKREFLAHLQQCKGANGIPLYYVIRDPELEEEFRREYGNIGD